MKSPLDAMTIKMAKTTPIFAMQIGLVVRSMNVLGKGWGLNKEDRAILEELIKLLENDDPDVEAKKSIFKLWWYICDNFGKYHRQYNFAIGKAPMPNGKVISSEKNLKTTLDNILAIALGRWSKSSEWIERHWDDELWVLVESLRPVLVDDPTIRASSVSKPEKIPVNEVLAGYGDW